MPSLRGATVACIKQAALFHSKPQTDLPSVLQAVAQTEHTQLLAAHAAVANLQQQLQDKEGEAVALREVAGHAQVCLLGLLRRLARQLVVASAQDIKTKTVMQCHGCQH